MQDRPITEAVADQYLREHLLKIEAQIDAALQVKLNDNRYSALVSFVYNLGIGAFRKSTLLKTINNAPGAPGVRDEFMKWTKATDPKTGKKVILTGLVSRRREEADLYFS
jgi:lysozyme